MVCEQPQFGKVLDGISQGVGKGLKEGTAAAGTGLIEEDVVDGAGADFEAFDVLPADVDDKIHLRQELFGGGEMGHRFHHAVIHAEGVADDVLAIAGDGAAFQSDFRIATVKVQQKLPHQGNRIAVVGLIDGGKETALSVDDRQLDGGGTGVDADIGRALIGVRIRRNHHIPVVAQAKGLIFLLVVEQRGHGGIASFGVILFQALQRLRQIYLLAGAEGRPHGHIIQGIFRANAGGM